MSIKTKSILMKFVKGALSGAATALGMITVVLPTAWNQFPTIINMLGIAAIGGALNGLISAFIKYASWKE